MEIRIEKFCQLCVDFDDFKDEFLVNLRFVDGIVYESDDWFDFMT